MIKTFLIFLIVFLPFNSFAAEENLYYGIYFSGGKIGYSHIRRETVNDLPKYDYKTVMRTFLSFASMGKPMESRINSISYYKTDYSEFLSFFNMRAGVSGYSVHAEKINDEIVIETNHGGRRQKKKISLKDAVLPNLAEEDFFKELYEGKEKEYNVFHPELKTAGKLNIKVTGKEEKKGVEYYAVETRMMGVTSKIHVDEQGIPFLISAPGNIKMLLENKETALNMDYKMIDLIDKTSIEAKGALNPVSSKFKIISGAENRIPSDSYQAFKEGIVTLSPLKINDILIADIPKIKEYLREEEFIEVNDSAVIAVKKEVKDENLIKTLRNTEKYLSENIKKTITLSFPSAVETLRIKQGDCNEYAALAAAVLRACGIPAKTAAGIAYINGKYYYHAWNEVYDGEKFVPVDFTLNKIPVRNTHIKLAEGNLKNFIKIVEFINNIKVEILN